MTDIRDKARSDRNWIERIMHHVPGFSGYLGREERRETDKLLRVQLAGRLDQIGSRLDPVMRELTDSGGLKHVGVLDRFKKKIQRVADKIRHASYGYSGWFEVVKVREAELDRLYAFDAGLVDRIVVIEDVINQVRSATSNPDSIRSLLDQAESVAREMEEQIDRRDELITGYKVED